MKKRNLIPVGLRHVNSILRQGGPDRTRIQGTLYIRAVDPLRYVLWYNLGVQLYYNIKTGT